MKLTNAEITAIERLIRCAKQANSIGDTFGMTDKSTRLVEKLYTIAKGEEK